MARSREERLNAWKAKCKKLDFDLRWSFIKADINRVVASIDRTMYGDFVNYRGKR